MRMTGKKIFVKYCAFFVVHLLVNFSKLLPGTRREKRVLWVRLGFAPGQKKRLFGLLTQRGREAPLSPPLNYDRKVPAFPIF